MKQLVEYPLQDGGSLFIEQEVPESQSGLDQAALSGEVVLKAQQTLEGALEQFKPAASAIVRHLRGLADAPDEFEVEFGLKVTASVGIVVSSGSTEANLVVRLRWKSTGPS